MDKSNIFRLWLVLIGGGLFGLPLFYLPYSTIPFEVPKVWFLMGWSILVSILTVFVVLKTKLVGRLSRLHLLVGSWLLVSVVASFLGVDQIKSWLGNYYRWDGLVTTISMVGLFLALNLFPSRRWLNWALSGMAMGNLVSALWAGTQMIFDRGVGFDGFGAGFGQPVFLSGYLLVTTPFVWWLTEQVKKERLKFICFWLATLVIVFGLTATRALTSLACFPILLAGLLLIKKKINLWQVIILLAICLAGVMIRYYGEIQRGAVLGSGLVYESRQRLFMKAYLAFKERPLLGWGIANFDKAFESVDWPIKIDHDIYADKAHSNLVEVAVGTGVLGLGTYLILVVFVLRKLLTERGQRGRFLLLALVVYLIHSQTNVTSIAEEVVFWLVVSSVQME